jgi:hypothetical protein
VDLLQWFGPFLGWKEEVFFHGAECVGSVQPVAFFGLASLDLVNYFYLVVGEVFL